jgi:ribosomal protein L11 methyltransferase
MLQKDDSLFRMWMVTVDGEREDFGEWPVEGAELREGQSIVYFSSLTVAQAFAKSQAGKVARALWHVDLSYQKTWTAKPVGARWWLAPPWASAPVPPDRIPLEMKTGLVFGGGDHATTCAALELLERIPVSGRRVFDLGAGTGILSEAAQRLGASLVIACDLESDAASMAHHRGVPAYQGPSVAARPAAFDLVLANIPGYVHLDLASEYSRLLLPAGHLILSGYYEWQVERIEAALGSGFVKTAQIIRGDAWVGALYQSRAIS